MKQNSDSGNDGSEAVGRLAREASVTRTEGKDTGSERRQSSPYGRQTSEHRESTATSTGEESNESAAVRGSGRGETGTASSHRDQSEVEVRDGDVSQIGVTDDAPAGPASPFADTDTTGQERQGPDTHGDDEFSKPDPQISVIMPTLNEEEGISECIDRIEAGLEEMGVSGEIIISDSSDDRTPEIARERGAKVVEPNKRGYGYAYRYAFEHARGDYIVIGDADTTYDFEELPRLFAPIMNGEADLVMGSRLNENMEADAMPWLHRHIGNPLLTKFLNVFYDAGVSDAHSGFRVIRREALEELNLRTDGMEFASEMVMKASVSDFRIVEVPITYRARAGEAKLESFRDGWRHVRFMLENAPAYLFSVPGGILGGIGLLIMLFGVFDVSVGGATAGIGSEYVGALLVIVGTQIGLFGLFSSVASDPIRKPQDPFTRLILEHQTLERGIVLGLGMFAAGILYSASLLSEWIASGFSSATFLAENIIALTAIVIGTQLLFSAFFMSVISERA